MSCRAAHLWLVEEASFSSSVAWSSCGRREGVSSASVGSYDTKKEPVTESQGRGRSERLNCTERCTASLPYPTLLLVPEPRSCIHTKKIRMLPKTRGRETLHIGQPDGSPLPAEYDSTRQLSQGWREREGEGEPPPPPPPRGEGNIHSPHPPAPATPFQNSLSFQSDSYSGGRQPESEEGSTG
ncbi:hypothetical protein EYF80_036513 [Liparis tanakae]|uniref:Uncharacterized protein n=1 Tax=Liparis tanakae TaxID=230148 RepID=A0A4Z2GIV5_9TELE|nr:hypothetical protein EYF80_036513 [Liparis tanakae]